MLTWIQLHGYQYGMRGELIVAQTGSRKGWTHGEPYRNDRINKSWAELSDKLVIRNCYQYCQKQFRINHIIYFFLVLIWSIKDGIPNPANQYLKVFLLHCCSLLKQVLNSEIFQRFSNLWWKANLNKSN
jgi:hypothetical protein